MNSRKNFHSLFSQSILIITIIYCVVLAIGYLYGEKTGYMGITKKVDEKIINYNPEGIEIFIWSHFNILTTSFRPPLMNLIIFA